MDNQNKDIKPKKEKKFNIVGYFILMLIIFLVVETLAEFIAYVPALGAFSSKYGEQMIGELFWGIAMLFVVLAFGNSYIFTDKKESLFKGLLLGIPEVIIAIVILLGNSDALINNSFINIVTLLLYCIFIGITEEFMCRAWIQNEFIERYGKTRRQVIISICLASLIFGIIHLSNLLTGQTLLETVMQVLQATSGGMLFGAVYYRTKNIWSVVTIHAFWDFAILLGEMGTIKDCTYGTPTNGIIIYNIISTIPIILVDVVAFIILMRKTKIEPLINKDYELTKEDENKDSSLKGILIAVAIIGFFATNTISNMYASSIKDEYEKYETCYNYDSGRLEDNVEYHFPQYKSYTIDREVHNIPCEEYEDQEAVTNMYHVISVYFDLKDNKKITLSTTDPDQTMDITYENTLDDFYVIEHEGYVYSLVNEIDEDNGSVIYYSKIPLEMVEGTKDFYKYYRDSFTAYKLPYVERIGYITYKDKTKLTPYIVSEYYSFFINEEDNLLVIDK